MKYLEFDGNKLSKIALGAADFGAGVNKTDSFALMDEYVRCGGNIIDTGRVYSAWIEGGANASESTIGAWLKERKCRDKVWIATKGGHPPINQHHVSRINAQELRKDMEESLRYLQTDYVDIYYLHRDDPQKAVSEIMPVLNAFVKEGKTRYIGASNWTAERIEKANAFAKANNMAQFTFSEIMWSYAKVNDGGETDDTLVIMNDTEYEAYRKNGLIVMPFGSQAQGFYTLAKERGVGVLPVRMQLKYCNETNLKRLQKISKISEETGLSPTAVGLNHLLCNKVPTIPIVGGFSLPFLQDSLRAFDLPQFYCDSLCD